MRCFCSPSQLLVVQVTSSRYWARVSLFCSTFAALQRISRTPFPNPPNDSNSSSCKDGPSHRCTIRGGTLVTSSGTRRADLGIGDDGRIAAIEPSLPAGREDIDATDLFLLPGGVDSHCHIEQRTSSGLTPVDDFYSASVSALAGGTTTIVPFACQHRGKRIRDVVADYRAVAAKAAVDYAFHVIVTDPGATHAIDDLQACFAHGCSSVKVYMTYDALKLNDTEMLDVLEL